MDDHDTDTLDSIIKLINHESGNMEFNCNYQSERLVPLALKLYRPSNPHQRSSLNMSINNQSLSVQPMKTLKFKPWSGVLSETRNGDMIDYIREEIVG